MKIQEIKFPEGRSSTPLASECSTFPEWISTPTMDRSHGEWRLSTSILATEVSKSHTLRLFLGVSLLLLLGFTTLFNISGHQRRFLHWAWKVRQILLRGSNFGLRLFYQPWSYDTELTALLSFEGSHAEDFYARKNPPTTAGFEPANLVSSGEYDKHWTTSKIYIIKQLCVYIYIVCYLTNIKYYRQKKWSVSLTYANVSSFSRCEEYFLKSLTYHLFILWL